MKTMIAKNYNWVVLAVWAFVWLNFVIQYRAFAPPLEALLASTILVALAYPFSTYISTTLLGKAMSTGKWRRFAFRFLLITIVFAVLVYVLMSVFAHFERTGFFKNANLFSDMGGLLSEIVNVGFSALIINLGFCGLRFWETTIRLQKELHESQLQTLNGQINPHSMFNVLNHIHVLLQKDPQAADSLLLKYSDILRYQLYNANKNSVSLRQDTDFLKQYIEVEKIRWKNKITVTESWTVEDGDVLISPLLFISFLENAFKYVARSDSEQGCVDVAFVQSGNTIDFTVSNSKSRIRPMKKEHEGLGLPNIRKRLDILFPTRHELAISDSDESYTVHLTLRV